MRPASSPNAQEPADPVARRLEAARRAIEGRFLAAGDTLSQAVEGVGELIASLDQLTGALAPAVVQATTAELQAAADSLSGLPAQQGGRQARVRAVAETSGALNGCIEAMRQDLAYLRVFAINIKITAGGIAAAGPEFAVFAQEIHDCIDLGRSKLDAFAGEVNALRDELQAAIGEGETLARRCAETAPAVAEALGVSAAAMAEHHERIATAAAGVASLARDIQKKVAGALSALQIGDITRQRIEHVQAGLEMLERLGAGLAPEPRERLAAFVHRLLAAQTSSTAEAFHGEAERIGLAMAGIAADAREILRLRDLAYGRPRDADTGFLRSLEANVGQALQLVADLDSAEQADLALGRSAAEAAQALTAGVAGLQAIRVDVQQMALNTTLKCARIGDTGRPLGVVAVELRVHAERLEESAGQTLATLQDVTRGAEAVVGAEAEAAGASRAATALQGATTRIHAAAESVESDLAALAERGAGVVDALTRASQGLALHAEIGAILDEAEMALDGVGALEVVRTDDIAEVLTSLLDELYAQYTMAGERTVHTRIVEELGFEPEAAPLEAVG
jgi:hypothetical protein